MQKIKYIIIFTLVLALAIITVQLTDYQKITSVLLKENNTINQTTEILNKQITLLQEKNQELQNKIISLEEKLTMRNLELNNQNFSLDTNITKELKQKIQVIEHAKDKNDDLELTPNISIDDENKITGFGLEYKQKF